MILQLEPATREFSEMPVKMLHIENITIESVYISRQEYGDRFINIWRRDITGQAFVNSYKQTTKRGKNALRIARAQRIQEALDAQGDLPF